MRRLLPFFTAVLLALGFVGAGASASDFLSDLEADAEPYALELRSDLHRIRREVERRAEELAAEGENEARKVIAATEEKTAEAAGALERKAVDVGRKMESEAGRLEAEAREEYEELYEKVRPYLEDAEGWVEKEKRKATDELANVIEEGLSDARAVLRDLSHQAPNPVPAPVVPAFDSALSDVALPMQVDSFPERPAPLVELGNPFFGEGYIGPGFELPTGTMAQPQFFFYGLMRSGVQTFDDGVDPRVTQVVHSLQLFANLNITPTERFLVEFRPLDNTSTFTGYNFEPGSGPESGFQNGFNGHVYTLFFEGNFLSLFPGLDNGRSYGLGFDFSVGRQLLSLQSGVLVNDSLDMIAVTHPSLFTIGSSATTASLFYAWGNIHRGEGGERSRTAQLLGGFLRSDFLGSTLELDFLYSPGGSVDGGQGLYFAASAIQRFGKLNTNFTAAASFAPDRTTPDQTTVNNGGLLFAQLSTDVPGTENILYLDAFWAIGRFTSASRAADAGGPLGQTGLLFAATGLGDFGAALGSSSVDTAGAALGTQIFFDDLYRRQLIVEVGAQTETVGSAAKSLAAGVQFAQAIGQHWVVTLGAVGALQEYKDPLYGLRMELSYSF